MKQNLASILAATILAAAMSIVPSCRKAPVNDPYSDPLNPPVKDLPAAAFTLSADEDRYTTFSFPWTISAAGKTDSVLEEIDDMCVTSYNVLTLFVEGSGAAYKGVNVASSNTAAVQVAALGTREGKEAFSLTYVKDGEADITVWNGSGAAGEKRTTFHVTAVKAIFPKALVFLFDEGTEREKEIKQTKIFIDPKESVWLSYYQALMDMTRENVDERGLRSWRPGDFQIIINNDTWPKDNPPTYVLHTLSLKRIEPENTSFRHLSFQAERYNEFVFDEWLEYLESNGLSTDWTKSWSGDYKDFDKTCYFAVGGFWGGVRMSLGEFIFKCSHPNGSNFCKTAILCSDQ